MSAESFVPERGGLRALAAAAAGCRGCELYERATRTVFGAGPARARVVLVGEQPGDVEDRQGAPFVGPAGHVLDRALADAGIERDRAYLTNAVKHFRWKSTALGATAAHALFGASFRLTAHRGELLDWPPPSGPYTGDEMPLRWAAATVHPSAILRVDPADRDDAYQAFVRDLKSVAAQL